MVKRIRLVRNDERPEIDLTLTDKVTKLPFNLSAATTFVYVHFRPFGSTAAPTIITCVKIDAANGIVRFDFTGGVLTGLTAGAYEGEVKIDFDGIQHTVYDLIKFQVRDDFDNA